MTRKVRAEDLPPAVRKRLREIAQQPAADVLAEHYPSRRRAKSRAGAIRVVFLDLIDAVALVIPEGPDATIAARRIHDAYQACIFPSSTQEPSR